LHPIVSYIEVVEKKEEKIGGAGFVHLPARSSERKRKKGKKKRGGGRCRRTPYPCQPDFVAIWLPERRGPE